MAECTMAPMTNGTTPNIAAKLIETLESLEVQQQRTLQLLDGLSEEIAEQRRATEALRSIVVENHKTMSDNLAELRSNIHELHRVIVG